MSYSLSRFGLAGLAVLAGGVAGPAVLPGLGAVEEPVARAAATCAEYQNQAAAQRAADTRDADGDGVYCETLPCPCSEAAAGTPAPEKRKSQRRTNCVKPQRVKRISFSATEYPNVRAHFRHALARGWPRTLVLNRRGADARRDWLLEDHPTKAGFDRDEYPPAVGRGKGLRQGAGPRGWQADVEYVPSSENRSHGATMGSKLRRFCDGTRFRYVFR